MRQILFKAKRIDNGEWVEGYYSKSPDPLFGFLKDFIFAPYYDKEKECGYDNGYKIDPNTICQFTGLYDKNGNKIWENDVVRESSCGYEGIIEYIDAVYCIEWIGEPYIRDDLMFWIKERNLEVIENIFDHKELLEGGGE